MCREDTLQLLSSHLEFYVQLSVCTHGVILALRGLKQLGLQKARFSPCPLPSPPKKLTLAQEMAVSALHLDRCVPSWHGKLSDFPVTPDTWNSVKLGLSLIVWVLGWVPSNPNFIILIMCTALCRTRDLVRQRDSCSCTNSMSTRRSCYREKQSSRLSNSNTCMKSTCSVVIAALGLVFYLWLF